MDTFDFVIIGAGPAGEAAAHKARELGASAAIVDRRWFGGSCPFIGCLPSKALLFSAARHAANPATVQDEFFRIGGMVAGKATNSLVVNNNDTIVDHTWT